MSSDNDDVADPYLFEVEDGEEGEFDEDQEFAEGDEDFEDEELENGEYDDIEEEEEEEELSKTKKTAKGKAHAAKNKKENGLAEPIEEESEDDVNGANGVEEDEGKIMEELQSARMTADKYFQMLVAEKGSKGKKSASKIAKGEDGEDAETFLIPAFGDQEVDIDQEKLKEVQQGKEDLLELINELKNSVSETKQKFLPVAARLKNNKLQMNDGLNFLDAKFSLINSYCANLAYYVLLKVQGKSIKDHPVLRRLIYIKTLVSKLKPLDKKLEYQINKMLRLANEETLLGESYGKKTTVTEDPLSLKPRPDTMSKTLTTEEIDIAEDGTIVESKKKKEGKYIAPKLVSTLMEDEAKSNRKAREEERRQKKQFQGEMFKSLHENYEDAPVEIRDSYQFREEEDEREKAKRRYEEDNFIRLPLTKEDKKREKLKLKRIQQGEDISDLSKIREIGAYWDREKEKKNRALDAKDSLMKKTLAATLAKRRSERHQDGGDEDEFFNDMDDDDGGKQFFGARKQFKNNQGGTEVRKPQRGGFDGHSKMGNGGFKGRGGKRGGFGGGRKMGGRKSF